MSSDVQCVAVFHLVGEPQLAEVAHCLVSLGKVKGGAEVSNQFKPCDNSVPLPPSARANNPKRRGSIPPIGSFYRNGFVNGLFLISPSRTDKKFISIIVLILIAITFTTMIMTTLPPCALNSAYSRSLLR